MLKRLAIVALVALVGFDGHSQTQKTKPAQANQQPAAPVSNAPIKESEPSPPQPTSKNHIEADVRVIDPLAKDRYDKAAFWIDVALAVVGVAGIGVGIFTLIAIKRQAHLMEVHAEHLGGLASSASVNAQAITKQADLMEKQLMEMRDGSETARVTAKAATDSAKAASTQIKIGKETERAKLVIRYLDAPEISAPERIMEGKRGLWVRGWVENLGRSKAFSVRACGLIDIVSDPAGGAHEIGFLQDFPQIVSDEPRKYKLNLSGFGREFEGVATVSDRMWISDKMAEQIRNGDIFVKATGLLSYEDIFGDAHETPFLFVWKSFGNDDGGRWRIDSRWFDSSPRST